MAQRLPASVVSATDLPRPNVQPAKIVRLASVDADGPTGEIERGFHQRIVFFVRQHVAGDRRQRVDALEHFVREGFLRLETIGALENERLRHHAGFLLKNSRQCVGRFRLVKFAAGEVGDLLHLGAFRLPVAAEQTHRHGRDFDVALA